MIIMIEKINLKKIKLIKKLYILIKLIYNFCKY